MRRRRQSLPVLLLVKTAYQLLWQQRDDALRLGLVPTLLVFGGFLYGDSALRDFMLAAEGNALEQLSPDVATRILVLGGVILISVCLLTVNWLRFLLLGPMGAVGVGLAIGRPHIRFLIAMVFLGLAAMVVAMAVSLFLAFMPAVVQLAGNLALVAALMVLAVRFLPFLVGQAIGQPLSLAQSWNASRGNGMAVAMSLILAQIPFFVGLIVLQQILDGTGFSRVAPAGTTFIASVGQVADWICQAGVLAAAYRHLVGVRV